MDWKLVPVEPTLQMITAAWRAQGNPKDGLCFGMDRAWSAFLAAAPAPEPAGDGLVGELQDYVKRHTIRGATAVVRHEARLIQKAAARITALEEQKRGLVHVYELASELCAAIDLDAEDIGTGERTPNVIKELGPACDETRAALARATEDK